MHCPLCNHSFCQDYFRDKSRQYRQCQQCALVFVDKAFHLSAEREKAEYDKHRNSPLDAGYRQFLSRLAAPLLERLPAASQGLDFGCGPGPTLSGLLEQAGHRVSLYDIFYYPDESVWQRQYQFITATEVVEHLSQPGKELERLWHHLQPGGTLGLMTKLVIDKQAFARWHYKNDPTHICFFSRQALQWQATQWRARLELIGTDVVLFTKPGE